MFSETDGEIKKANKKAENASMVLFCLFVFLLFNKKKAKTLIV